MCMCECTLFFQRNRACRSLRRRRNPRCSVIIRTTLNWCASSQHTQLDQTSTYAGGETGALDPGGPLCWWLGGRRGTLCWGGDGGGMQGGGGTGGAVGSPVGRGGRGGRGAVLAVAALVSNMPVLLLGPGGGGGGGGTSEII